MLLNILASCAVIALFLVSSTNAKSGYWTADDLSAIKTRAEHFASKSTSSQEIFHALQLLSHLSTSDKKSYCDNIVKSGKSANSAYDLFFAVKSNEVAGCSFTPSSASQLVQSSLKGESVTEVAGGLLLGNQLNSLSESDKEDAASKLKNLLSVDGELKLINDGDVLSSLNNVHAVMEVLVALHNDKSVAELENEIVSAVTRLLPTGNGVDVSDPTFLEALSKLSEKKVKLTAAQLQTVAEALFPLKHADDATTLSKAYDSLARVRAYKSAPLFVRQQNALFHSGEFAKHVLNVEVHDVLGKSVEVDEFEVASVKGSGKDTLYAEGLKSKDGSLDLSGEKLTSGRYLINLSANIAGKQNPIKYQGYFLITDKINVEDVHIGVTDSKDISRSELSSVNKPNSFSGSTASAIGLDFVHINYAVSSEGASDKVRKPHQSFVRLTHRETGYSVNFPTKKSGEGSSLEYSVSIALGEEVERFNYLSGEYIVSILVGDATFSRPVEWLVGSVTFKFPTKPVVNLPLYARSLLHTSDTTLQALPEIEHQMRPPAKRASNFMAATFAGLSLVPLLGLVGFILSLKPDLAKLRSLSSVGFVLCLGATLALYAGYWFALDGFSFYQTIKYLAFSLPVTLVVGKYALNSVSKLRQTKTKQV